MSYQIGTLGGASTENFNVVTGGSSSLTTQCWDVANSSSNINDGELWLNSQYSEITLHTFSSNNTNINWWANMISKGDLFLITSNEDPDNVTVKQFIVVQKIATTDNLIKYSITNVSRDTSSTAKKFDSGTSVCVSFYKNTMTTGSETFELKGKTDIIGETTITGETKIDGDTNINGETNINGDTSIVGDANISGALTSTKKDSSILQKLSFKLDFNQFNSSTTEGKNKLNIFKLALQISYSKALDIPRNQIKVVNISPGSIQATIQVIKFNLNEFHEKVTEKKDTLTSITKLFQNLLDDVKNDEDITDEERVQFTETKFTEENGTEISLTEVSFSASTDTYDEILKTTTINEPFFSIKNNEGIDAIIFSIDASGNIKIQNEGVISYKKKRMAILTPITLIKLENYIFRRN